MWFWIQSESYFHFQSSGGTAQFLEKVVACMKHTEPLSTGHHGLLTKRMVCAIDFTKLEDNSVYVLGGQSVKTFLDVK